MSQQPHPHSRSSLFRPVVRRLFDHDLSLIALLTLLHLVVRFAGVHDVRLIALSMAIVWPLPWLLMSRDGRRRIGLRRPEAFTWLPISALLGMLVVTLTVAVVWLVLGASQDNWFVHYGRTASDVVERFPPESGRWLPFLAVVGPAMTLSPVAEEVLYRGMLFTGIRSRWGDRAAAVAQSAVFAVAHLANYGLVPFQPVLNLFWLPSMFVAAMAFQFISLKARSLWPSVLAHSAYNLGMTVLAFTILVW